MSRIEPDGSQHLEFNGDLVGAGAPGEPLTAFLTLFYYGKGVFPWLRKNERPLWWSPQPRAVLFCGELHVNRTLRKTLRRGQFRVSADTAFNDVVSGCRSMVRGPNGGSWIDEDWVGVMETLHRLGHAHSVEVWEGDQLVGGLFGVCVGQMFYGCSMFHAKPNASKVALVHLVQCLVQWDFPLIDCALYNPHLRRMGARLLQREEFHRLCGALARGHRRVGPWTSHFE